MPKRILLADDSITIQKVVELTFSDGDYDVVAVNNGAKAIQKLSEMRPDLILSDIIMPEKNGYEVCEFVKSHPEYRTIPVILLTGTFEPFDPDRADKAGCDAVVTKPFESQSLIHKVEELIQQARAAQPSPAPPTPQPSFGSGFDHGSLGGEADRGHGSPFATPPAPPAAPSWPSAAPAWEPAEPSPFGSSEPAAFETPAATPSFSAPPFSAPADRDDDEAPSPFAASSHSPFRDDFGGESASPFSSAGFTAPPPADSFGAGAVAHESSIFGAAAPAESSPVASLPFEQPEAPASSAAFGGETRAFPRMSFEELQAATADSRSEAPRESSPWDAAPPEGDSGATRAFPRMSFEELQQRNDADSAQPPVAAREAAPEPSPWDDQADGGATRAFPRMSFDELQQMANAQSPAEPLTAAPSAWGTPEPASAEPEPSPWETPQPFHSAAPEPESQPEPSPWTTPAAGSDFSGETRAFPRMSFVR